MSKRLFVARGWLGLRFRRGAAGYLVLRDVRRHPPLFSERNGYVVWHLLAKIGSWELGFK